VIEARNQSGTNLIGARPAQDIPDFRFPDSSIYEAADQICEKIARKQANNADETDVKCVVSASHDHNASHIATRVASASASSVLPLLINRFLRRSNAFTAGVTNFGSDDVTRISRSDKSGPAGRA